MNLWCFEEYRRHQVHLQEGTLLWRSWSSREPQMTVLGDAPEIEQDNECLSTQRANISYDMAQVVALKQIWSRFDRLWRNEQALYQRTCFKFFLFSRCNFSFCSYWTSPRFCWSSINGHTFYSFSSQCAPFLFYSTRTYECSFKEFLMLHYLFWNHYTG